MNTKKLALLASSVALITVVALAGTAFAKRGNNHDGDKSKSEAREHKNDSAHAKKRQKQSLTINAHGNVNIHGGVLTSVSGNILGVQVWGLALSVNDANANIHPATTTLSVGEHVDIHGTMATSTSVIQAATIHIRLP